MGPIERAWRGTKNDWRLHFLSVFSVAVAFVCLASALLVVVNVDSVRERWASAGHASVYLKPNASEEATRALERALLATPGVKEVRFVSAEVARRELLHAENDATVAELPTAAFPASFELELVDEAARERLERISTQLLALPVVESVETYGSWSKRWEELLAGGVSASVLLGLVVLGAVLSVVSSTIRLTLERRRKEVEILRLVGATEVYVRRPFVIEGMAQGATGALLAILLVLVLFAIVRGHFDSSLGALLGASPTFLPWTAILGMIGVGGLFGGVAAHFSLRQLGPA
jgi:cell division transport system permease protein